jgi:hypothetical protein
MARLSVDPAAEARAGACDLTDPRRLADAPPEADKIFSAIERPIRVMRLSWDLAIFACGPFSDMALQGIALDALSAGFRCRSKAG